MGLSMGGSLTLWSGLTFPGVAGLVCVNPATMAQPTEVIEMISGMVADGTEIARPSAATSPIPTLSRSPTTGRPCERCCR